MLYKNIIMLKCFIIFLGSLVSLSWRDFNNHVQLTVYFKDVYLRSRNLGYLVISMVIRLFQSLLPLIYHPCSGNGAGWTLSISASPCYWISMETNDFPPSRLRLSRQFPTAESNNDRPCSGNDHPCSGNDCFETQGDVRLDDGENLSAQSEARRRLSVPFLRN